MKKWFKHSNGFVNIDTENIYFTNTGNWSETHTLQEKSIKIDLENKRKFWLNMSILSIVFLFFGIMNFLNYMNSKVSGLVILFGIGGSYSLYRYLQREIGASFKIPMQKITSIHIIEKKMEVHFVNGEDQPDHHIVKDIEHKAIYILEEWKHLIPIKID